MKPFSLGIHINNKHAKHKWFTKYPYDVDNFKYHILLLCYFRKGETNIGPVESG